MNICFMQGMVLGFSKFMVLFNPFHCLREILYLRNLSLRAKTYPNPQLTMITASFVGAHSVPSPVLRPRCLLPYKIPTVTLGRCSDPMSQMRKWRRGARKRLAQTTQLESGRSGTETQVFLAGALFSCTHCFLPLGKPCFCGAGSSFWLWLGILGPVLQGGCWWRLSIFHWSCGHSACIWASCPAADLFVPGLAWWWATGCQRG